MASKIKKRDIEIANMCVSGVYSIPEAAKKLKMNTAQAAYHILRALREQVKRNDV